MQVVITQIATKFRLKLLSANGLCPDTIETPLLLLTWRLDWFLPPFAVMGEHDFAWWLKDPRCTLVLITSSYKYIILDFGNPLVMKLRWFAHNQPITLLLWADAGRCRTAGLKKKLFILNAFFPFTSSLPQASIAASKSLLTPPVVGLPARPADEARAGIDSMHYSSPVVFCVDEFTGLIIVFNLY